MAFIVPPFFVDWWLMIDDCWLKNLWILRSVYNQRLSVPDLFFCAVLLVVTKIEANSCASLKRGKTFFLSISCSSMMNSNQNSDSSCDWLLLIDDWFSSSIANLQSSIADNCQFSIVNLQFEQRTCVQILLSFFSILQKTYLEHSS